MATTSAQVQQLYVGLLGRAADKAGLDYWLNQLNASPATLTLENLRSNIVSLQPEYKAIFGSLSRVDTVTKIYNNLFGRAPEAAGLTYWSTGAGASVNIDQLTSAFIAGASAADTQALTNKTVVAEVYTSTAGTAYLAADAKTIVTGVTTDSATVGTALAKLTDGSLSGIALTTGVANLKASATADAAVKAFETANVATLKALAVQIETLSKANAQLTDTAADTTVTTYAAAAADVSGDLTAARGGLGTTATLNVTAANAATDLTAKATAFRTSTDTAAVDKMTAYDTAVKAAATNVAVTTAVKTEAVSTLTAYAANTSNATVWTKALTDAGITASGTTATDVNALYTFLTATGTTAAQVTTITNDFNGVAAFTSFGAAAAKDKLAVKATADLSTASTALTSGNAAAQAWKTSYDADATAKLNVTASTALDALDSAYSTIKTADDAAVSAAATAQAKLVPADAGAVVVAGATSTVTFTDDAAKAQVFYFPTKKADGSDGSVTLATAKDSLYIGEGYTLKSSATLTATGITGADNNALEVFFFKDGSTVKAVIETTVAGSVAVTGTTLPVATDTVSVITLTGVTDVSQVTFANGVISHV